MKVLSYTPPLAGFQLEEAYVLPGTRLREHGHAVPHLCFVLSGGFVERTPIGDMQCGPGVLRLSPANSRHDIDFGEEGAHCLLFHLDARSLPITGFSALERDSYRSHPSLSDLVHRVRSLGREHRTENAVDLKLTLLELLARAGLPESALEPEWLCDAHARVQSGHVDSVGGLARSLGIHRAHLSRWYRRFYGYSVRAHLESHRLRRALRLVLRRDTPLAEVALDAGYADQSHMTSFFTSRLGVPPAACRRAGNEDGGG